MMIMTEDDDVLDGDSDDDERKGDMGK